MEFAYMNQNFELFVINSKEQNETRTKQAYVQHEANIKTTKRPWHVDLLSLFYLHKS